MSYLSYVSGKEFVYFYQLVNDIQYVIIQTKEKLFEYIMILKGIGIN